MKTAMRIQQPTRSITLFNGRTIPTVTPVSQNNLPKISPKPRFFTRLAAQSSPQSAMVGESESFSTTTAEEISTKYGFDRLEMYKGNLAGTVHPYDRHLFLCYKSHELWPSRIEDSESDPLPKLLASALKARKNDLGFKTRLTICEGVDDLKLSDGDVLIFPEMIICRGLKDSDVESFIEDVLVNGKPWQSGVQEGLTGSYVFVCAHNNRDRRCGVCGPVLIEKFKEEIESKGLKNQVVVTACSHVGGHKYAGNIIIFSADPKGKNVGNWYGYVTSNDVFELLDKQIGKGEIVDRIWRGRMGGNVKEAEKINELKLGNETNLNNNEKQTPEEIGNEEKFEAVASCCQGINESSCCKDETFEKKPIKNESSGLSFWTVKWEQHHVLTAVAVVGALALAYGFLSRRTR